ncbi:MAG TPA: hypothetical protein VFO34_01730, partial [Candidatus Acidoferrales bacterium]|nr:hypothetical protein [Candidatus Acidoferrales bacterium]
MPRKVLDRFESAVQPRFFSARCFSVCDFAAPCKTRDALENAHFMNDELNLDTESSGQAICR